jgi:hypothetical protein
MVVIGLLLVVVAAGVAVGLALVPGATTEMDFYGLHLPNLPARSLVLLGVVIGIVFMLGLSMIRWGFVSASRRRKALKEHKIRLASAEREAAEARRVAETREAEAREAEARAARSTDTYSAADHDYSSEYSTDYQTDYRAEYPGYPADEESPTAELHPRASGR